jgi:hypothetical protein
MSCLDLSFTLWQRWLAGGSFFDSGPARPGTGLPASQSQIRDLDVGWPLRQP